MGTATVTVYSTGLYQHRPRMPRLGTFLLLALFSITAVHSTTRFVWVGNSQMGGRGLTASEQLLQNGGSAGAADNTGVTSGATSGPADGSASALGCATASGSTSGDAGLYGKAHPCEVYAVDSDVDFVGVENSDAVSGGANNAYRPGWLGKSTANNHRSCTEPCTDGEGCWTGGTYGNEKWLAVGFGANSATSCGNGTGLNYSTFSLDFKCVNSDDGEIKLTIHSTVAVDDTLDCTSLDLYVDGNLTGPTVEEAREDENGDVIGHLCKWVFDGTMGVPELTDESDHRFDFVVNAGAYKTMNLTQVKLHTGGDFTACEDQKACLKVLECQPNDNNCFDPGQKFKQNQWYQYLCLDRFVGTSYIGDEAAEYMSGYSGSGSGSAQQVEALLQNGAASGGRGSRHLLADSKALPTATGTCTDSDLPTEWTANLDSSTGLTPFDLKCTEWASCLDAANRVPTANADGTHDLKPDAHDVRKAIHDYLKATGCSCSAGSCGTSDHSGRRLLQDSDGCLDPSVSDPESWDCNCHDHLAEKCNNAGATSAQMPSCYQHYLCTLNSVCASWKSSQGSGCTTATGEWSAPSGEQQLLQENSTKADDLLSLMADLARTDAQTEAKVGWDCG